MNTSRPWLGAGADRTGEGPASALAEARLKRWPALFHSLRSSYDTEMRGLLPEYAVDRITGHSAAVARKHCNQVLPPDVVAAAIKPFARAPAPDDRKRAG